VKVEALQPFSDDKQGVIDLCFTSRFSGIGCDHLTSSDAVLYGIEPFTPVRMRSGRQSS
jgi:hypothetical protein